MYLVVGVTALFAIADRQRGAHPEIAEPVEPWTPDRLIMIEDPRPARWSDLIVEALVVRAVALRLRQWSPAPALAATALTLAGTVPLAWLFWQAQVLNHALTQDTGDLARPGSWIAWLAVLVLALVTAGSLFRAWRPRGGGVDSIALQAEAQR